MTIDEYINNLTYSEKYRALPDEEKSRCIFTANAVLARHYLGLDALTEDQMNTIVAEEAVYIAANPWAFKNAFNEYDGLSQFNVHEAVGGTVDYEHALSELSNRVKQLAQAFGLVEQTDITGNYTAAFGVY